MALGTVRVGPESTFATELAGFQPIRSLEDHLDMICPDDYPLLTTVGLGSGGSVNSLKYEWQEDTLIPLEDAIDMAGNMDNSQTNMVVDHGGYFRPGDVLLVEDELMWVKYIEGNTLYVKRAFAGTSAASHNNNTVVYNVGNAQLQGSAPGAARNVEIAQYYNYPQIWSEDAEIFIEDTQVAYHGMSGAELLNYRLDKRLREMYQAMERSLIYGKRNAPSTNDEPYASGGLATFLSTNLTDKSGAALEEKDLIDVLESIFKACGASYVPDLMVGNTWPKRKMTAWYRGLITTERAERVGGARIDHIETDFGDLDLMIDHLVKPDELYLLRTEDISSVTLGNLGLTEWDATIPGKAHQARRAYGVYGWKVKNEKTMAKIYNFSTTS